MTAWTRIVLTSTLGGELLFAVMSAIATMESRIKTERACNGVEQRRARGKGRREAQGLSG
jgi:DNA invertase Pin-like site-specific DNA recombinase